MLAEQPMRWTLPTSHGDLELPTFLPDATRAVVRGLDAQDLAACGIQAVMVNAFHLANRPGSRLVARLGGVHKLMAWPRPVASDSGGFQLFSLLRQNPKLGTISDAGAVFRTDRSGRKRRLTPEKSIRIQLRLGSDILICLDDCTHPDAPPRDQERSVRRTIAWARRCRREFDRLAGDREPRPLLFAVVQGGRDPVLRRQCVEGLVEIGFDGYCFGGWPFDAQGAFVHDAIALTAELLPRDGPKFALGIGNPSALADCHRMGYRLFDCVLPTRDARRGRLYAFTSAADASEYRRIYIRDAAYHDDPAPVSEHCDCRCCRDYSRAYLHHLFAVGDVLAWRLATIHNLRFYAMLTDRLRGEALR